MRFFVFPPRPPKLNGRVERAHRTHRKEFYEITSARATVSNGLYQYVELNSLKLASYNAPFNSAASTLSAASLKGRVVYV